MSGTINYTVRISGQEEYECAVDDAPGPKCSVCGHEPCPFCKDWCDTVNCQVGDEEGEDDEKCPCYEKGECSFDPVALAAYESETERRRLFACFGGSGAMFAFEDSDEREEREWYWRREAMRLRSNLATLDLASVAEEQADSWARGWSADRRGIQGLNPIFSKKVEPGQADHVLEMLKAAHAGRPE